jgi:TolB-like protein/DNA-binding winged helix-turn-helix (wHTH) protein/Tfp pilus assembly protein PilF
VGVIRLGDELDLDTQAYELRRGDSAVKLERIPMEILLFLLEKRPHLVTREQLAQRIWGSGVFLDIDNSINGAIHKIRQALKDDPENPRFIRTVTGKGYRFIATAVPASSIPAVVPAPDLPATPPARVRHRRWLALAAFVMVAVAVGVAMGAYFRRSQAGAPPSEARRMLAVLPFENLTGDPSQDYFSDGFTEEMITRLGILAPRRLGVIARTSVMYYKDSHTPLDRLGRELGVQYVLEGSVRRNARRVRITAQLIEVKDQAHLWAQQYDREQTDVLQVQEEIAQAISNQIEVALGPLAPRPALKPTLSEREYEAYEQYLRGRYFWNKRTAEDFKRAVESFQLAVAADPRDARAYAGLADTYALMGTYHAAPREEVVPKARNAALKALEIDPNLAAALPALALVNEFFDLDWQTAEARFKRAIELDPNYATAHHWYAELLGFEGRMDEALRESAIAMKLDPRSLIIATDRAYLFMYARQWERAEEQFRAVLAVDPNFPRAMGIVGVYINQGRYEEALAENRRWQRIDSGPFPWAAEANIHGRLGQMEEARAALREVEKVCRRGNYEASGPRLLAYLGMGLKEEAMATLQERCKEDRSVLLHVKVNPDLDPLRGDPRFDDLIRCIHLEP